MIIIIIIIIIINVYIEAKKSISRSVDNVLEGVIAWENEANAAPFTPNDLRVELSNRKRFPCLHSLT